MARYSLHAYSPNDKRANGTAPNGAEKARRRASAREKKREKGAGGKRGDQSARSPPSAMRGKPTASQGCTLPPRHARSPSFSFASHASTFSFLLCLTDEGLELVVDGLPGLELGLRVVDAGDGVAVAVLHGVVGETLAPGAVDRVAEARMVRLQVRTWTTPGRRAGPRGAGPPTGRGRRREEATVTGEGVASCRRRADGRRACRCSERGKRGQRQARGTARRRQRVL